jgi:[acyl-carrier-protein] S-malonyltransferase
MSIAFTFPGQGSQAVGMGQALAEKYPEARAVFAEVDAALGDNLSVIAWTGPLDALTLTENTQPALMAVSIAALRVLAGRGIDVRSQVAYVAGHSLGEYSALVAAGSLGLADAARLLRLRGRAMQTAVPVGVGAMAALIGLDYDAASEIAAAAAEGGVCAAANDNAPGQVVVSGDRAAVERAVELARARGAKRAILLPVSAPFHCSLMAPAAAAMEEALATVKLAPPAVPLVANVVAGPTTDPEDIRRNLVRQVTATVRWRESIAWLGQAGVDVFVEIGAGRVLSGLAKRIVEGCETLAVGTPDEVDKLVGRLS